MTSTVPGNSVRATGDRHERQITRFPRTTRLPGLRRSLRHRRDPAGQAPARKHGAPHGDGLGLVPRASEAVRRWLCCAGRMRPAAQRLAGQRPHEARAGVPHGPPGTPETRGVRRCVQRPDRGQAAMRVR